MVRVIGAIILMLCIQKTQAQQEIIIKGHPFKLWGQSAGKIIYDDNKQSCEFFWWITPDSLQHQTPDGGKYINCIQVKIFDTSFNNTDLTISIAPLSKLRVEYYDKGLPEEKQLFSVPTYKVVLRTKDSKRYVDVLTNYRHATYDGLSEGDKSNEILIVFKEKADAHAFVKMVNELL